MIRDVESVYKNVNIVLYTYIIVMCYKKLNPYPANAVQRMIESDNKIKTKNTMDESGKILQI